MATVNRERLFRPVVNAVRYIGYLMSSREMEPPKEPVMAAIYYFPERPDPNPPDIAA